MAESKSMHMKHWLRVRIARLKWSSYDWPIHSAARAGDTDLLARLIEDGEPLDVVNSHSHTALELAVYKGHLRAIEMLVGAGASHTTKNFNHAVAIARHKRRIDVLQLLTSLEIRWDDTVGILD